jgi:general secretion pathway protein G
MNSSRHTTTARCQIRPRPGPAKSAGFTLIEILVVVVIVGILGAIIVPNLMGRPDQARITAAESDIRNLANALDIYRLDNFVYPSTEQGLEALVSKPAGFPEPKNYSPDGYIKSLPTDPWGSPYIYERDGDIFRLFSLGADGQEGGEGLNADISYEDL